MRRLKASQILLAVVAAATALVGVGAGQPALAADAAAQPRELTSDAPVTVVASGLNGPRNLAWGPSGHLLVTEVGSPPLDPPSVCNFISEEITIDKLCYGLTGSISDISSGTPVRIVTGLASYLNSLEMVGANDLEYVDGQLYVLEAESPQTQPPWLPVDLKRTLRKQSGALLNVTGGSISVVANPGKVNYQWMQQNPELSTSEPAANPYALTPKPGGGFYLVDSASNTLGSVDRDGKVDVLAWFPLTPAGTDAVPTCLDMGPDGALYIGQFTGLGNSATAANVYRYAPSTGELTVWQSGFSSISGCGFGANGDFYVTEFSTTSFPSTGDPNGVVIQISQDGSRTVLGEGQLFAPSGFLAGPDGSIYVCNNTIWWPAGTTGQATAGEVVKIG